MLIWRCVLVDGDSGKLGKKNPSSPTEESKFRLLVRVNYSFTVLSHTSMERHTGVGVASYANFFPIFIGCNREPRDVALFNKLSLFLICWTS